MTRVARQVVRDCELSVDELEPQEDARIWRLRWVATVTLLRAVGHVLEKVDTDVRPAYRKSIDAWWQNLKAMKPEPAIFWSFIDLERNSILKEYGGHGVHIAETRIRIALATGERMDLPRTFQTAIEGGPFDGRNQTEVVREAISWWRRQLDEIDATVRETGH